MKRKNSLSFSFSHSALVLKLRSRARRFSKKKKRKRLCAGHGCSNAPIVSTVNPLLSPPPPPQDSFFSDSFEGRLNREGGLIYLEKTVVSVLYKELEYKAEKPKY